MIVHINQYLINVFKNIQLNTEFRKKWMHNVYYRYCGQVVGIHNNIQVFSNICKKLYINNLDLLFNP